MHEMNLLCQTFQLLPVAFNNSNVQQQYSAADIYTGTTAKQCNLGIRNVENLSTERLHTAKRDLLVYNDVCYDRFTAPKIDFSSTIKDYLPVPWSVVWTCSICNQRSTLARGKGCSQFSVGCGHLSLP